MIKIIQKIKINRENKRFIERLKNGEVNYGFKLAGSKNIEEEKVIVEQLTRERSIKTEVERRKHKTKVENERRNDDRRKRDKSPNIEDFEDSMGGFFNSNKQ